MIKTIWDKLSNNKAVWMIASLMAAVVIWIYITSTSEMEMRQKLFTNVPVRFLGQNNLREAKGLIVTNIENSTVNITLRGNRTDIAKLESSDLSAVIDLSTTNTTGYKQISYTIQYPTSVDNSNFSTVSRSPAAISFYVDKLSSRMVEVRGEFTGSPAKNYIADLITMTPNSIYISGAEEELSKISHALVTVPRENVDATVSADLNYVFVDAEGNPLELKTVECETEVVNFHMPILMTKEVALQVSLIEGGGATAANVLTTFEDGKETIKLAGTPEDLEQLNQLSVGTVNLASFVSEYEEKFTVPVPNNMRNLSDITEVTVKFEVIGLATKSFTVADIECVNTPPGFTAEVITSSIDVKIRGTQAALDALTEGNIRAQVDLSDIKNTGSTVCKANILIAGAPEAGAVLEYTVVVQIASGE